MSSFHEYYLNNLNTDVLQSTKWVPYLKLYDLYTSKFKFKKPNILEIGARHGGSLLCYKSVFQDANIFGVDINSRCKLLEKYGFHILIGSQNDDLFLSSIKNTVNNLDIIIDDGSHIYDHIYKSYMYLFPLLNDGGLYVIEDLHKDELDYKKLFNFDVDEIIVYDQI